MATDIKSEGASRSSGRGGHRLSAAFEAVNSLPALSETVARVKQLTSKGGVTVGELTDLIESDTAITVAVMRAANNGGGPRGRVSNVADAVELLKPERVESLASRLDTYELFRSVGSWKLLPERFRRHAVATRYAAERIAEISDVAGRDELATSGAAPRHRAAGARTAVPGLRGDPGRRQADPRGADAPGAPRARDRPHPGRRRPRPPLGLAAADRERDRAPPLGGGHRPRRRGAPRRPRRAPVAGRRRLRERDRVDGRGLRPRA